MLNTLTKRWNNDSPRLGWAAIRPLSAARRSYWKFGWFSGKFPTSACHRRTCNWVTEKGMKVIECNSRFSHIFLSFGDADRQGLHKSISAPTELVWNGLLTSCTSSTGSSDTTRAETDKCIQDFFSAAVVWAARMLAAWLASVTSMDPSGNRLSRRLTACTIQELCTVRATFLLVHHFGQNLC